METTASKVLDIIKEELGVQEDVSPEATFEELGLDSLDYICLINELRLKVGPITREQAQQCLKVSDLLAVYAN